MARMTKAEKLAEQRIENAYRTHCSGVQISVMDIGKVFAAGRKAIADGADDAALGVALKEFVETIRCDR